MMNNLPNAIVFVALILTFAFASELGPSTRGDASRTARSTHADTAPATALSNEPASVRKVSSD